MMHRISDKAREKIAGELAGRLPPSLKAAHLAKRRIELLDELPVWTLRPQMTAGLPDGFAGPTELPDYWHLQIHCDQHAAGYAQVERSESDETHWTLMGAFSSPIAHEIDRTLKWLKEHHAGAHDCRLLFAPANQVHAILFEEHDRTYAVVAARAERDRKHLKLEHRYTKAEFMAALRTTNETIGVIAKKAAKPDFFARIMQRKWGIFTLGIFAALAADAWLTAHAVPMPQTNGVSTLDLLPRWIGIELSFFAMFGIAGRLACNRIPGIFIDSRNRMSLARFQLVLWTVILLGAYFAAASWNIAHHFPVPKIDADCLKLLGIAAASPVISTVIITGKMGDGSAPGGGPASSLALPETPPPGVDKQIGSIDVNATPAQASWADLYLGEETANRSTVDVTRLQQLVITFLLVIAYSSSLWALFGGITIPIPAKGQTLPFGGIQMPQVDDGFVWLLGISHAGYLAYKATPKMSSGS